MVDDENDPALGRKLNDPVSDEREDNKWVR
jgi:hypothetical protein